MTLSDITVVGLFFYAYDGSEGYHPVEQLAKQLGLQPGSKENCFQGLYKQSTPISLTGHQAHDNLILQIKLSVPGTESDQPWQYVKTVFDMIVGEINSHDPQLLPWAMSRLFYGRMPSTPPGKAIVDNYVDFCQQMNIHQKQRQPDMTAFGWLWMVNDRALATFDETKAWQRDFLLIIPEERFNKVKTLYIDPLRQGFTRIELYCQKCKHLARQHEVVRSDFSLAIKTLQNEFLEQIRTSDFNEIHAEPVLMEKMSRQLMRFSAQKAAVELLLNSLRNNLSSLGEHLDRVKMDTPAYAHETAKLIRQIEQIEVDLQNANVIQESTCAIQDIQRSTEGSRFERASYLLGGSAALLAGISLFNSFLDIWSLVLDNSTWVIPPAWVRIPLSLFASISISLAAIWLISRKKPHRLIASLISLAALCAMFLSTFLINI